MDNKLIKDELFVEDFVDSLTNEEATYYLSESWNLIFKIYPTRNQLACLWAQSNLETAGWASIHVNNFGNIKKTTGHKWTMFPCHEYDSKGIKTNYFPPHIQTGFNAYDDALIGAKEYIEFLKNRKRYLAAWLGLMAGDLTAFNNGLATGGYFTAPPQVYYNRLLLEYNKFQKNYENFIKWQPRLIIVPEDVSTSEGGSTPVEEVKTPEPLDEAKKYKEPNMWDSIFKLLQDLFLRFK